MPSSKKTLKARLARYRQIKISVIGRKSGRTVSIPVWFVGEGDTLYLLPVQGSDTQWYKNGLQNPSIRIDARGVGAEFRGTPVTEPKAVESVVEKFREKYGAKDVKRYYSKLDVAVLGVTGLNIFCFLCFFCIFGFGSCPPGGPPLVRAAPAEVFVNGLT